MTDIHFKGTITKATFIAEKPTAVLRFWVEIEPGTAVEIEADGTVDELVKKFELKISADRAVDFTGFEGRKCDILRNAQGYRFISFL